ncbi:zinc-dependent alcohol dehydrogenase [Meiothermus rufus]|uniref:zinc-dependent alcohol dehydrogenase n=1 Tax=Meiothermus rufus TaxID=604332 RepID=UPI0003F78A8C|nr:alcohol dehydrogenase catalytic domain-containing protein [Meiothermus rufus]
MQTVIPEPHQVIWADAVEPIPGPGEVLLRPLAVGICGSDLHVLEGQHPFVRYPVYPGHEVAAEVVALGPGVEAEWLGARVALEPSLTCGCCNACRSGRYNICENLKVMGFQAAGAMAERFVSPVRNLHRLPPGLSPEAGALVEPLAVAVHAVTLTSVAGRRVAVLGAGPIGLLVAQVAQVYGATEVSLIEPSPTRRARAEALGLAAQPQAADRYEVLFECVGHERALEAAIKSACKGAQIVVVGVYGQPTCISAGLIQDWELGLKGSLMYTYHDYCEALRLLAQQKVDVTSLVTHRFALEQVAEAFKTAQQRDQALKVLLLG